MDPTSNKQTIFRIWAPQSQSKTISRIWVPNRSNKSNVQDMGPASTNSDTPLQTQTQPHMCAGGVGGGGVDGGGGGRGGGSGSGHIFWGRLTLNLPNFPCPPDSPNIAGGRCPLPSAPPCWELAAPQTRLHLAPRSHARSPLARLSLAPRSSIARPLDIHVVLSPGR